MLVRNTRISPLLPALLAIAFALGAPTSAVRAQAPPPIHKNWVQRHPTATAIGAAALTHHALKVSAARKKRLHEKLNWAERHPTISAIVVGGVTHHEIKAHTPHN